MSHAVEFPEHVAHGEVHGSQVGIALVVSKKVPGAQTWHVLLLAK